MTATASEICLTTSSEMFNSAMWLASAGRDILPRNRVYTFSRCGRSTRLLARDGTATGASEHVCQRDGIAPRRVDVWLGAAAATPMPLADEKAEVRRRVLANEFHISGVVQTARGRYPRGSGCNVLLRPGQSVVTARKAVAILETCCSRMPAGHGLFASRGARGAGSIGSRSHLLGSSL